MMNPLLTNLNLTMVTLRPRKQRDCPSMGRNGKRHSEAAKRTSDASLSETLLQKRVRRARDHVLAHLPGVEVFKGEIGYAIERLERDYDRSRNRVFTSAAFRPMFRSIHAQENHAEDPEEEGRSSDAAKCPRFDFGLSHRHDLQELNRTDNPMTYEHTPFFIAWASEAPEWVQTTSQKDKMTTKAASMVSEVTTVDTVISTGFTDATTEVLRERHRPQVVFAAQGFYVSFEKPSYHEVMTGFAHAETCFIPREYRDGLIPDVRKKVQIRDRLKAMGTVLTNAIGHSLMHKQMGGTGLAIAMTGECFSRLLAVSPDTVVLELTTTTRFLSASTASRNLRSSTMKHRFTLAHELSDVATLTEGERWRRRSDVVDTHAALVFRDFCRLCVQLMGSVIGPSGLQPFRGNEIDLNALLGGPGNTLDCSKAADLAKLCEILGARSLEEIREPIRAWRPEYSDSGGFEAVDDIEPSDSISNVAGKGSNTVRTLKALRKCGTLVRVVSPKEMDLVLQRFEKDLP